MHTEQAYISGFVKRAAEYGLSAVEAYQLLKESAERPGLWANIRAKRARGEKPARPGNKDYPDREQWNKLTKSAVAAWQRSEGKNPEGGLNAKGRASYKRETGGTLKAPVSESNPKGERAKRQNSFCSRMCGMKRVNTGSEAQSDPDSRINKSLRKWNCKCGECNDDTLLKEATTFGATKNLLKQLKSQGVSLHRSPAQTAKNFVDADTGLREVARGIKDMGPGFQPDKKILYIPKQKNLPKEFFKQTQNNPLLGRRASDSKTAPIRNYNPRNAFFHEAGHAMHHIDDPRYRSIMNEDFDYTQMPNLLAKERIANNNAINFMKEQNVPAQNVANYIRFADRGYGSYLHGKKNVNLPWRPYSPSYSVEK